jgi:hypothetical protein
MPGHDQIQFDLVKLLNGEGGLRLTDPQSGLSLSRGFFHRKGAVHPQQAEKVQKVKT